MSSLSILLCICYYAIKALLLVDIVDRSNALFQNGEAKIKEVKQSLTNLARNENARIGFKSL